VSAVAITLETTTRLLEPARSVLATIVSPILFLAETPYLVRDEVGDVVATRDGLIDRNRDLERRVLELSQISQQYLALKAENDRLRELLGSRARLPADVLVAELVGVVPAPGTRQVLIDKGSDSGVEVGQAVIDAEGLIGQIVEVGRYTSRVLLITDPGHAVPVEVNRNGVRSIAGGTGDPNMLELEDVPVTADIRQGDLLISSGLGGRFPRGYPVGRVEAAVVDPSRTFALVTARASASLDRTRHVLVIFESAGVANEPDEADPQPDEETDETVAGGAAGTGEGAR
jgi:rod shape-determining protein MreC